MTNKIQLQLTPQHKQAVLMLIGMQYLLFFTSITLLVHYHSLGLSFLPYPSMATTEQTETHFSWNTLMVLAFWVQHIVMATLAYKVSWVRRWKYFALYDRYVYNVMSGIFLILTISQMRPSFEYLFTIPKWICWPVNLAAVYMFVKANKALGKQIMMPFSVKKILNNKVIEVEPYEERRHTRLISSGIYGTVRHPMQAGALLLLIFGNGVYTTQRLIFNSVMALFVIVGVLMEEKRLCFLEENYPEYMRKVKARFIPYLI